MTAKWLFEPKRRNQKSRDPMQASFFTNSSIDDDTHALVREAIQNSMDAKSNLEPEKPVYVRFSLGSHDASTGIMDRYISEDAWHHFNAEDNGLINPPTASENCRFLVYEDFNTNGLIGDETASEIQQSNNSFYFFMRAEGQSGKHEGERGRHGIGKYVFPYTSGIRMFIAITVRTSDNRCLIAGQSVLKSHHVGKNCFTPDGWWGIFDTDGFQLPVEDKVLFKQLATDFGLSRKIDQSGLSLIMPYIQPEVSKQKLVEHIISEYFWPIMNGDLVVEVVEDDIPYLINDVSIHDGVIDFLPADKVNELTPFITLASNAIIKKQYTPIELKCPDQPSMPKWDKEYLPKEVAKKIQEVLSKPNGFIKITCPLYVEKNGTKNTNISYFDIYMSKDITETMRKPQFLREGILIPESRVNKVRGYTSMIVIEAGLLATLLGDAENPAHTEWEKNATKFKNKYRWGSTTIDFVRLSINKILNLMNQGDDEEDVTILSDIFYLDMPENDDEVPDSRKQVERKKTGGMTKPPIIPPVKPRPHFYRLTKSQDGFIVNGPIEPFELRRKFIVKVAYDFAGASKSKALKLWDANDFDLSKAKNVSYPCADNVDNLKINGNTIEFVANSNEFSLSVQGFDHRRDIIVSVESEAILDEAV
ncbi:TPA: hypothetical protein ACGR4R_000804 [Aeromonas veronii]|uniref:Uncharacterized protein n=4 Tax=Aeromonas veronii TaxID=654 RepID=K1JCP4_AERVE|nr:hypothetical protein [Aeromonas veronii]EKB17279.1 hypothetical protein HMPREF1168_03506 [Aeromonas veronii AMC34]